MHQPSLSRSAPWRYVTFAALYAAQGIPEGLTFFGIPAWLALNEVEAGPIGAYLAVITLPWSFKLLAGPLMDRWTFLPMGRRRPWVLFGQLGLILSLLLLGVVPAPLEHLTWLSAAGFLVSFFGAFQDVATDGMAVDVIPVSEQARANGLMWGAKTLGTAASLSLSTWLINHHGLDAAVIALASGVTLIMMLPLFLRERPGERRLPWMRGTASPEALAMQVGSWRDIGITLRKAFTLRGSLAMAVGGFGLGMLMGYMDALLPVFTIQRLDWSNEAYANTLATAHTVSALAAMAVGGWLVDRLGHVRLMNVYLGLLLLLSLGVALSHAQWMSKGFGTALIGVSQVLIVFLMVAYLATSMALCWRRVAATQFTLFMAIGNMGRGAGAALIGPARNGTEWPGTFLVFGGLVLLSAVVVQGINVRRQQRALDLLEREHLVRETP
ncbi:MAG TPA: MFS transporter [Flavobacteriales bacterium]|nr:MFS transporter [Flavobacteriales bacterium]